MNSKKIVLIIALAFVLLLGGAYVLYGKLGGQVQPEQLAVQDAPAGTAESPASSDTQEVPEEEKTLAPDFTVYDREGTAVTLSAFRGKPVVLNFWASWCGPCKSEMPDFDTAYAEYGEDIHFLLVNMTDGSRETKESAVSFVEESGYSFPVYYDTDSSAAIAYGVYSLPTTYFIDADGYAIAAGYSALDLDTLKMGIEMIYAP